MDVKSKWIIVAMLLLALFAFFPKRREPFQETEPIYCLMVTGKDDERMGFARASLRNFTAQTHPDKRLIIVNHHPRIKVLEDYHPDVTEIAFDKGEGRTLGNMRNLALGMVPMDALWTTWDNDDYHHPTYLSQLYSRLTQTGSDAVFQTRRYEYNYVTDFAWGFHNDDGFWIIFARRTPGVMYLKRDSNEDLDIREQVKHAARKFDIWPNEPYIYIRTVHGRNTSTSLDQAKATLNNHQDFALSASEKLALRRRGSERLGGVGAPGRLNVFTELIDAPPSSVPTLDAISCKSLHTAFLARDFRTGAGVGSASRSFDWKTFSPSSSRMGPNSRCLTSASLSASNLSVSLSPSSVSASLLFMRVQ